MYAVIETGGKQLRVEEGQAYFVEKLDVNAGDEVVIDKVVLFAVRLLRSVLHMLRVQKLLVK